MQPIPHFTLAIFLLRLRLIAANPLPSNVNTPISEAEWASLRSGGLESRATRTNATINQPISSSEWQALQAGGLSGALVARDKVMNCGRLITGKGGSHGHGVWIPVGDFVEAAERFYIFLGHETSDTYPVFLTNQDDDTQRGPPGNIVCTSSPPPFPLVPLIGTQVAIYNTERAGTYLVNSETCSSAMKAPLAKHLAKRDSCYGGDHNDYEGGYYRVDGIGAFGSEVYAAE
ncbi:MAG: hypothetical protein Q9195_002535 [Heterodermia aff. obscurata]